VRGSLVFNGLNAGIDLPYVETIAKIEIGNKLNDNVVTIEYRYDINDILSVLSEAKVPIITTSIFWTRAANERPTTGADYLSIYIYGEHLYYRIFLYTEANYGYVYVPYRGVYRINPVLINELQQKYMSE
jgi:hypothetical protein